MDHIPHRRHENHEDKVDPQDHHIAVRLITRLLSDIRRNIAEIEEAGCEGDNNDQDEEPFEGSSDAWEIKLTLSPII